MPQSALPPGVTRDHRIEGGDCHRHLVRLAAGAALHVVVDQRGVDLVIRLRGPAGDPLVEVDGFNGSRGEEHLFAVAETAGTYGVEVRPWSDHTRGAYALRAVVRAEADEADHVRAAALRAVEEAVERSSGDTGERRRAVPFARRAVALWRQAGEPYFAALATVRLARLEASLGDLRESEEHYRRALGVLRAQDPATDLPPVLNELGDLLRRRGRVEQAYQLLEEALARSRRLDKRREEAVALNNLALLLRTSGEPWRALDHYEWALDTFHDLGDHRSAATTLHNLGILYHWLGEADDARDALREAQRLDRLAGGGEAASILTSLGWVELWEGQEEEAQRVLERALTRHGDDRYGRATTLDRLGTASLRQGDPVAARRAFLESLALWRELDQDGSSGHTLANLANAQLAAGEVTTALDTYRAALRYTPPGADPSGRAHMLLGQAAALRQEGELSAARRALEEAVSLVESLHRTIAGDHLRSHYLATVYGIYAALVDLLMEQHRCEPAAGWDRRALETVEQSRARALLERTSTERSIDPAGRRRLARLGRAIERQERHLRAVRHDGDAGLGEEAASRLRGLLRRRERLATRLDAAATGSSEVPLLDLAAIRHRLLDPDTALLVIALGEERSFLWLVTSQGLSSHVLPPREHIEGGARRLRRLLVQRPHPARERQIELTAAALSSALLEPVAAELRTRRLLLMADGALQEIPFAALPVPGSAGEPLLARHEVIAVPSASVLAALRKRAAARPAAAEQVAVFAVDRFRPATSPTLDRSSPPPGPGLERSVSEVGLDHLPPLAHVGAEAAAVQRLAGSGASAVLGEAATLAEVGRHAGRHRILHFATHALVHPEHSELSGVVLADGFLQSFEVASLDLRCELVVLSACSTAVGEEVWGEGVLGLPRSFLAAGASGVVVSLWNVHDEATAVLMERFYQALLGDGLPPAAALREAQVSLRADPRWQAAYYWAPFVFVGDSGGARLGDAGGR